MTRDGMAARKLLTALQATPGRKYTASELAKTTGLSENQVSNAFQTLMKQFPKQAHRPARGVYEWTPPRDETDDEEFIVTVVMRKENGRMLVAVDDDKTRLFVMTPLADF